MVETPSPRGPTLVESTPKLAKVPRRMLHGRMAFAGRESMSQSNPAFGKGETDTLREILRK